MAEYQKALIVILLLAFGTFAIASRGFIPKGFENQFKVWRNTWFALTLAAFLAGNFWLYIAIGSALLLYITPKQQNPLALYFFLILALPPVGSDIPGFGLVNFLFSLDYSGLLALTILLPTFLKLKSQPDTIKFGKLTTDKFLITYIILIVLLHLRDTTVSDTIRFGFYKFTDTFLPYYVASRAIKNLAQMKEVLLGFVLGAAVIAAIGTFELVTKWLLYSTLSNALGVDWGMGRYLGRGDYLRAVATSGQPIVLGYVMMVALGFYLYWVNAIKSKVVCYLGLALLIAGLISPLSRGPWIGGVVVILVFIATGPSAIKRLTILVMAGLMMIPLLGSIPGGEKIINLLPFVGKVETENIDYRARLLEQAVVVFNRYPFFGSVDYRDQLGELGMRQGEGIVDVVNSYLDVVLGYGIVGLILFLGFFLLVLIKVFLGMRKIRDKKSDIYRMGRTLFSCLVAILITIFTVSSIVVIPVIYWLMAGIGISYARISKGTFKVTQMNAYNLPMTRLKNESSAT